MPQLTTKHLNKQGLFLVHGYKFNPESRGRDNPHKSLYLEWKQHLGQWPIYEFSYYSAPGIVGYYNAWKNGYRDAYSWAYNDLSLRAARDLFGTMDSSGHPPYNVLCHSLGSRVTLAAARLGAPIDRCILLNGAEMSDLAKETALQRPDISFYNVYARTDAVVDYMAENFTPGGGGSAIGNDGVTGVPNWINIVLDDKKIREWGRTKGWNLKGDNPRRISDHWMTYTWDGNWALYNAILEGASLEGIPEVS